MLYEGSRLSGGWNQKLNARCVLSSDEPDPDPPFTLEPDLDLVLTADLEPAGSLKDVTSWNQPAHSIDMVHHDDHTF